MNARLTAAVLCLAGGAMLLFGWIGSPGGALAGSTQQADADELPTIFHHDFRQPLPKDVKLFNVQDPGHLQFEPEGLVLKVPKTFNIKRGSGVGLQTRFGLKGDFEVTLTFDNFQAEAPGSPVGVGLGIDMASTNGSNVKISRVLFPETNKHAIRLNHWHDKKEDHSETLTQARAGRLRFQRTGATLSYLWAPETKGEEFKKLFQCELGTDDIDYVRVNVYTGGIPRAVEVRLLDLLIRGQKDSGPVAAAPKLTANIPSKKRVPDAPARDLPDVSGGIKEYPFEFYQDFRGQPKQAELTWFNVRNESLVKEQADGLHVTLPKRFIHDWGGVGVTTAFGIKGDFEVTTTFEILQAEKPLSGALGVGVILAVSRARVGVGGAAGSAELADLARVLNARGNEVISWDCHHEGRTNANVQPCTDKIGRLRFKRTGTTLSYLWAAGIEGGDFQEIKQCEYGSADIDHVRLVATTNRTPANVDIRLLDLRVRTLLPDKDAVSGIKVRPAVTVLIGFGITLTLLTAAGAWVFLRSGRRPAEAAAPAAEVRQNVKLEMPSSSVSFECFGCEKKLKVKSGLAGKKVKCPQCGNAVLVPETDKPTV